MMMMMMMMMIIIIIIIIIKRQLIRRSNMARVTTLTRRRFQGQRCYNRWRAWFILTRGTLRRFGSLIIVYSDADLWQAPWQRVHFYADGVPVLFARSTHDALCCLLPSCRHIVIIRHATMTGTADVRICIGFSCWCSLHASYVDGAQAEQYSTF